MMITNEQKLSAKKQFFEDAQSVDEDNVKYASIIGTRKINDFGTEPPGSLQNIWTEIKLMVDLVSDYSQGNYKEVPWDVIAAIAGALIYFVSPIDVIPDDEPLVGYLDDEVVLNFAVEFAHNDLIKYRNWKK